MSRRKARQILAEAKPGMTAKEFMALCGDAGFWFDTVPDSGEVAEIYNALKEAPHGA